MATRGKTYYEMHGDIKLEFADRHLQLLKEYARCYTSEVPSLKALGLKKLRAVAEVLALADRDRVNQIARRSDKPGTADGIEEHGIDRNTAIRAYRAQLEEQGHPSPASETAVHFGVSISTVQRASRIKSPER